MSIESDIVAALSGVASGRVYPIVAPEKAVKPFIVYKVQQSPIMLLSGAVVGYRTVVQFEAWGETYASALATAGAIQPALVTAGLHGTPVDPPEDGYDHQVDEYVRPVSLQFVS